MKPSSSLHLDSGRDFGGAQRRVLYLLEGLVARGHRVLLCSPRSAPLHDRAAAAGIACQALTMRSGLDFPSAVRLARLVRDDAFDLVHAHDPQSHSIARAAQGICHAASLHANLFVTHHDLAAERSASGHLRDDATGVHHVVSSRHVRDGLVRRGVDAKRIAVVPNGVDVERLSASRNAAAHDPWELKSRGMRLVGSVGSLTREKNPALLLQAFALLRQQIPDVHLLLVGDGPLRSGLQKRARQLGIADAVTFGGPMEDTSMVFALLEVFVLSSDIESLCSTALDAMAAGTPVVATAAAGILNLVRHGTSALVVPPRDAESLAQAIALLLRRPDLAQDLVRGGREVAQQHSVDRMVEATLGAYRELGQFANGSGNA
ncbi:MAG: glycosyltransferase family 4 protein [Candidatus Latescibacterota bacterium]|nr:MAG: glycosyltransferase family 4 protein [Candidatus Latescibacterota bacterium]